MGETCDVCKNESRISTLEKEIESNSKQHKEFYDGLKDNAVNQGKTEVILNQILSTVQDLRREMTSVNNKPAENWNKVIGTIIGVVVTAGVMYILNK